MSQHSSTAEILIFPCPPSRRGFAAGDAVWFHLAEGARQPRAEWAAGRIIGGDAARGTVHVELDHSKLTLWAHPHELRPRKPGEVQPGRQGFGL